MHEGGEQNDDMEFKIIIFISADLISKEMFLWNAWMWPVERRGSAECNLKTAGIDVHSQFCATINP